MEVLQWIFAIFAVLGAVDRIIGNKLKIGEEFEKGIIASGTLSLAMVGMICIAPSIAKLLEPVFSPVSAFTGIDMSFIGSFIANDMGGAAISKALATDSVLGGYNGLVVASMLGATVCFTVPVALKMVKKEFHKEVLSGILCGIATMPIGCIVSGLMLGIGFGRLMLNLLPLLIVSLITCIGLAIKPDLCRRIFSLIGSFVLVVITVGLAAGIFSHLTGKTLIPHMSPIKDAFAIVADVAIILAGVFPLIKVISKIFSRIFTAAGKKIGIDETSVLGLISSLANSIPTFEMADKMNAKGRMMNMAFAVSASFVFGDHLAFTMSFDKSFLWAVIAGKLISGVCAVAAAALMFKSMNKTQKEQKG